MKTTTESIATENSIDMTSTSPIIVQKMGKDYAERVYSTLLENSHMGWGDWYDWLLRAFEKYIGIPWEKREEERKRIKEKYPFKQFGKPDYSHCPSCGESLLK